MIQKLSFENLDFATKTTTTTTTSLDIPKGKDEPVKLPYVINPIKSDNLPKLGIDVDNIFGKKEPNFDIDGDGKLSEKEKAAAIAYHEKQAAEKIKNQFDFNKDGKLDDAEQAAYDAFVKGGKTKQASSKQPQQVNVTPQTPVLGKSKKSAEVATPKVESKEIKTEPQENQNVKKAEKNVEMYEKNIKDLKQHLAELEKELADTSFLKFGKRKQIKAEIEQTKRNIEINEGYLAGAKKQLAELKK